MRNHNCPGLHDAMWPGLVGKGDDSVLPIDLDTMLDITQRAEVDGVKFDGVDLFLADPHTSIDADDDTLRPWSTISANGVLQSVRRWRRSGRQIAVSGLCWS